MKSRLVSSALATMFVLAFSTAIKAEIFTAYLSGAQEVPPVATSATGFARINVDAAAGTCTFMVVFNNLSSPQNGAHIHAPAAIGATVGVAINLGTVGGTSGTVTGNCTINSTQVGQLRQHLGYVNVHSDNFINGEIRGQLGVQRPVDYDGDGRTDYSVLRFPNIPAPGISPLTYHNLNSTTGAESILFGGDANTDFPAPGDYDGDGKGDLAIFRNTGLFGIFRSATNTWFVQQYGQSGDEAHCRDYDGDGRTDLAVVRRGSTATDPMVWFIRRSSAPTNDLVVSFGLTGNGTSTGDFPVSGDYDGDGKFDIAIYRFGLTPANNFIVLRSSDLSVSYQPFGNFQSDYILPGDYDGDGKYDYAVARTGALSTSPLVWWILQSSNGTTRTITWGRSNDVPAQGDYDGDARTDVAIFRSGSPAVYWVFNSFTNSSLAQPWGTSGDFSVNTYDTR